MKSMNVLDKHAQIQSELEGLQQQLLPQPACLPQDVAAVLEFIHIHVYEPTLNVNTVKHGCRIRNNNISTRFRLLLGLGIREYIEMLRLNAASRFLRSQRFEVYLIAMAVGYEHQETFCRAFRRHFGRPPSSCF